MKTIILGLFVSVALAACGGGGGSSPTTATATTLYTTPWGTFPNYTHLTVCLYGDSTNYGSHPGVNNGNVPNQTPNNPAALMQTDFNIVFGPGVVTVIDRAEPGSTLADNLNGTGPYTEGGLAQELASNASACNIVLTNSEINDANTFTTDQYQTNLVQWVATVRQAGMLPVVQEPNPICLTLPTGTVVRPIDASFVDVQHSVSLSQNVTVLPVYNAYFNQTTPWVTTLQPDCVHPEDDGYEFKEGQYAVNLMPIAQVLLGR